MSGLVVFVWFLCFVEFKCVYGVVGVFCVSVYVCVFCVVVCLCVCVCV